MLRALRIKLANSTAAGTILVCTVYLVNDIAYCSLALSQPTFEALPCSFHLFPTDSNFTYEVAWLLLSLPLIPVPCKPSTGYFEALFSRHHHDVCSSWSG